MRFGGSSLIADPWGTMLAQGGADETILLADVDFSITERIRQKINVFRDRRPDLYKL